SVFMDPGLAAGATPRDDDRDLRGLCVFVVNPTLERGSTRDVGWFDPSGPGSCAMKLGDILVCLDPTDAGEHRLHLAATLAREHQAHLSAAYVLTESIAGAAPYGGLGVAAPAGVAGVAEGSLVAGIPAPGIPSAPNPDTTRGAALADIIEQRYREAFRPPAIQGDWPLLGG